MGGCSYHLLPIRVSKYICCTEGGGCDGCGNGGGGFGGIVVVLVVM